MSWGKHEIKYKTLHTLTYDNFMLKYQEEITSEEDGDYKHYKYAIYVEEDGKQEMIYYKRLDGPASIFDIFRKLVEYAEDFKLSRPAWKKWVSKK